MTARRARVVLVLKSSRCAPWALPQVEALRTRGHEVVALLPPGDGPVRAALRRTGVRVVDSATDFAGRPAMSAVAGLVRLRRQLRELAPDVLFYHLYASALATRLATVGFGVPRVHMVAGPLYLDSPVVRAVERVLARLDTVTIGGSEFTARRYRALGRAPARVRAIPYGVDTERFQPAPPRQGQGVRGVLGVGGDTFLALMVAYVYAPKRLVHRGRGIKGHAELLAAWRCFVAEHPDSRLVIVGGGFDAAGERHRRELDELFAPERHGIIWLDTVDDVRPYYTAADVSVAPSLSDNHGAALEAGAMGVPSIVSDAGALPETVGPGAGWVVPADDRQALAAALAEAHAEHRRGELAARGARAREWVVRRFDARRAAVAVADVVEATMSTRAARTSTDTPVVTLCTEGRFGRDEHGRWAATEAALGAASWSRYLADGARLRILARADRRPGTGTHALPDGVEVAALPVYTGLPGLVRNLPRLAAPVYRAVLRADVLVVRVPGAVGTLAALAATVLRRRYAVEVVGDPHTVLAAGVLGTAGRFAAVPARAVMRRVVRGAAAVQYVTERVLQEVYPPAAGVPVVGVSNVRLAPAAFVARPRTRRDSMRVLTVGSQEQRYKGHDVLLRALRLLADRGLPVTGVIVGGGRYHAELTALADMLGLTDRVELTGAVHDRHTLTALYDSAAVFALPSRTEGLPRVLQEAMARGLPAVGSAVGGIPELLDPRWLVPAGDHRRLAGALSELLLDDAAWAAQSARNLEVARHHELWRLEERFHKWLLEVPGSRR